MMRAFSEFLLSFATQRSGLGFAKPGGPQKTIDINYEREPFEQGGCPEDGSGVEYLAVDHACFEVNGIHDLAGDNADWALGHLRHNDKDFFPVGSWRGGGQEVSGPDEVDGWAGFLPQTLSIADALDAACRNVLDTGDAVKVNGETFGRSIGKHEDALAICVDLRNGRDEAGSSPQHL